MYKLDFEKAEEPEIKLPTSVGSQKKQGIPQKKSVSLTTLKPVTVAHNKLWKILKMKGIPHHLTCLLRNLYVDQEATVRILHGTMNWFKTGKEDKAVYCHPAYLTYMQSTSCEMLS